MKPISSDAVKILIVEDNRIDARLITHAIKQLKSWTPETLVIEDGDKAIHHLRTEHTRSDGARPDLVILDLNLPKRDGTEVLRAIREIENYRDLPVFILSSSPLDVSQEQIRTANLQADAYFVKPFEVGTFLAIAEQIYEQFATIQSASGKVK